MTHILVRLHIVALLLRSTALSGHSNAFAQANVLRTSRGIRQQMAFRCIIPRKTLMGSGNPIAQRLSVTRRR
jgi:hypothetical protein